MAILEIEVLRFADSYASLEAQAADDFIAKALTAGARIAGVKSQLVNDQREAAINQVLAGLAAEEQKARALLAETRETFNAGSRMAVSVNTTVQSLDAFVRSVSPPTNRPADPTNSKPFNVLDYGTAAGQVGAAARDLGGLLTSVNESSPQLARLRQETTGDAQRLVQHAFWLGADADLDSLGRGGRSRPGLPNAGGQTAATRRQQLTFD
jgi:hypothetical protein